MRYSRLNPRSRVIDSALPFSIGSGERAVLLLHGFTGYPVDMRPVAESLAEAGLYVRVPRLPGHGTDGVDFRSSDWRDWLRHATDEYLNLASEFATVHIGGLSMGGLLATLIAANYPVEKLLLLAPAFRVRNPLIHLSGIVGIFVERVRSGSHEHYSDPQMEYISTEYWDYLWPRQTWGLYRLQTLAKRALKQVQSRVLTVVSDSDETVPPTVAPLIERRVAQGRVETIILSKSGHVLTRDSEAARVIDESVRFLE